MNELSRKARAGSLTTGEEQELDSYLHIGTQLAILQIQSASISAASHFSEAVNRELAPESAGPSGKQM